MIRFPLPWVFLGLLSARNELSTRGCRTAPWARSRWSTFIVVAMCLAQGCGRQRLKDPANPGPHNVLSWEYKPDPNNPNDPLWTDVSSYFNSPDLRVTYSMNHVPLHGVVRYPSGNGPFPLVLLVHGNHDPLASSEQGYVYLLDLLASHGFIAASVDENFLNGGSWGEMDARAVVLLRHLQRWRTWNAAANHPFFHKVDLNRIGLAGHSRGGEAITVAWLFNTMLHDPNDPAHDFNFGLQSLFAIAPVDGQIVSDINPHTGQSYTGVPVVLQNADYFVMHGTHDGDVWDFEGYRAFDRAQPVNVSGTATKSLLWVYGAIHNQWNTIWGTADPCLVQPANVIISAADQQSIGKAFMSGFYQMTLQHKNQYVALLAGEVRFASMPSGITLMNQYQGKDRVLIDDYEETSNLAIGSLAGVTNANLNNLLNPYQWYALSDAGNPYWLWEQSHGLIAGWTNSTTEYVIAVPGSLAPQLHPNSFLSLRVGQIYEPQPSKNTPGMSQDFGIVLELGSVVTPELRASNFAALPYPQQTSSCGGTKSVLQTVRFPLRDFVAHHPQWHLHDLTKIRLQFNQRVSGLVAIDDIQIAK